MKKGIKPVIRSPLLLFWFRLYLEAFELVEEIIF